MIRSLIVGLVLLGGGFALSNYLVGYDRAGTYYMQRMREQRKSLRVGSTYYPGMRTGGPVSGGMRSGK
ncbi:MAG: hypothetical protein EPN93_11125 [Spirochaetes bacterium]|nr:MAG: hypothetical protein EPN93_11125 [Spirochaetota bacterium]